MYDAIVEACDLADASPVRVLIVRGSGGAFSSGTDIAQFSAVRTGQDGVAYEQRIGAVIDRVERLRMPTIAAVEGVAVGGGCALAVACDFRVCADTAAFGVPVARTLGNCLSMDNCARLADLVGPARVASSRAKSAVAASKSAAGTTRDAKPQASASSAFTSRPVISRSATRATTRHASCSRGC